MPNQEIELDGCTFIFNEQGEFSAIQTQVSPPVNRSSLFNKHSFVFNKFPIFPRLFDIHPQENKLARFLFKNTPENQEELFFRLTTLIKQDGSDNYDERMLELGKNAAFLTVLNAFAHSAKNSTSNAHKEFLSANFEFQERYSQAKFETIYNQMVPEIRNFIAVVEKLQLNEAEAENLTKLKELLIKSEEALASNPNASQYQSFIHSLRSMVSYQTLHKSRGQYPPIHVTKAYSKEVEKLKKSDIFQWFEKVFQGNKDAYKNNYADNYYLIEGNQSSIPEVAPKTTASNIKPSSGSTSRQESVSKNAQPIEGNQSSIPEVAPKTTASNNKPSSGSTSRMVQLLSSFIPNRNQRNKIASTSHAAKTKFNSTFRKIKAKAKAMKANSGTAISAKTKAVKAKINKYLPRMRP